MRKLKISLLYDNVHFLFILSILLILTLKYWYFCFGLLLYLLFIYKKTKIFKVSIILCGLIILSSLRYYIEFSKTTFYGTVVEIKDNKATIYTNGVKVLVYHEEQLSLGDYGYFVVEEVDYNSDIFDYNEHLLNKGIKSCCRLKTFEYKENRFVLSKIKDYFIRYLNTLDIEYTSYIKALVLADKSELEIYEESQTLGISHLIAVSGMHISLLVYFLEWLLKKLFYFEKPINIITIIFLTLYLFITNFEITVLRAAVMVILGKVFKMKNMKFTSLDILSITGIILLLINPLSLFLLSFELSFIVSFIIIIFGKNIGVKDKVLNTFMISLIAFMTTLPFIINTNYEINLLTLLIGPLYVLYFELILYPITLLMSLIPIISNFVSYFYIFFEETIHFFDNIKSLNLIFGEISVVSFVLYEVILYFLFVSFEIKRGRSILLVLYVFFLMIIYNKNLFNPFYKITMYDVGQGDSFLIAMPFDQGNILIDCYNNVDKYLKRDGIKEIDIIFLSHGHSDHINAYEKVVHSFRIKKTYSSKYDKTEELSELKKQHKIYLLKSEDKFNYKDIKIEVLGPIKEYKNANDNSLVLKVIIEDITILFTGDIEKEAENDLIDKYHNKLDSDILKASHHGSKTSNTNKFLEYVTPDEVLISVGKNNWYGFPNNKYLLTYCDVYRTDLDGCITILKRKNYFHIAK